MKEKDSSEVEKDDGVLEPEPSKKKKVQRKRITFLDEVEFSSSDEEAETSQVPRCQRRTKKDEESKSDSDWSQGESLVGLVGGNQDEFENLGYAGVVGESFIQNSMEEDNVGGNTLLEEASPVSSVESLVGRRLEKDARTAAQHGDSDSSESIESSVGRSIEEDAGTAAQRLKRMKEKKRKLLKNLADVENAEKELAKDVKVNRKRKATASPPRTEVTSCPVCDRVMDNVGNVRRHMTKVHKMSGGDISKFKIKSVSQQGPNCHKPQTNLWLHINKNRCKVLAKRRLEVDPVVEKELGEPIETFDAPMRSCVSLFGAEMLLEKFADYQKKYSEHALETRRVYYNSVKSMLLWMERNTTGFKGNKLLFPLECGILFPGLTRYMETLSPMSKPTAAKAYLSLCAFQSL